MKSLLLLLFIVSCLFSSCQSEEINPSSNDYIVFGHFYGECAGTETCVEIFKLEQNQLLEDTKDNYPSFAKLYDGNYVKLSSSQFEAAKDLINKFPRDLWKESDKVLGNPDDRDQGGLYVEFKHKGKRRFWILDKSKDQVPAKYHPFMEEVIKTITLIQ